MQDFNDDNFDLLLRKHLQKELDGQLGRAPAAFAQASRTRVWRGLLIGAAGVAAAAAVAIALLRPAPASHTHEPIARVDSSPMTYDISWQTEEHGTVFLDDDVPMQAYVQRQVEVARWVDPTTHATVELTVPREQIMLIGMETY